MGYRRRRDDETDDQWETELNTRRAKTALRMQEWRAKNPEKNTETERRGGARRKIDPTPADVRFQSYEYLQDAKFRSKYGLTRDDVLRMAADQGNKCAVCGRPGEIGVAGRRSTLCVDHDHDTGKIRALLCVKCNVSMWAVDDETWLAAAIAYRNSYR